MNVNDIRNQLVEQYKEGEFVTSRDGSKTIEILGASFVADEPSIFGKPNTDYIRKEIMWYESESTNVFDLSDSVPAMWSVTANKRGEINSNYGHLIYSEKYFSQFNNALDELTRNPNSRRATVIYTRPSIWVEYNENGKNDFICTNAVTYYIRNNKVHCVVQMRSNDVVYGYKNDYAWQDYLLNRMTDLLNRNNQEWPFIDGTLVKGNIYWQVQNLHVYERHFKHIEDYIRDNP